MNDPHVAELRYEVTSHESVMYRNPPVVERETDGFRLRLQDGLLVATMKEHHATPDSARSCVEPYLIAWEISASLHGGPGLLRFQFKAPARIVDRNPPPPNGLVVGEAHVVVGAIKCTAVCHVDKAFFEYPEPPQNFAATPDVQTMWFRFAMYLDEREPLLSMAYACLTLLEGTTGLKKGARAAFCKKYNVDRAVRDTLGDLVSKRGSRHEARKLDFEATQAPLSDMERRWVEDVVKALIKRKAEYDYNPSAPLPAINLANFVQI